MGDVGELVELEIGAPAHGGHCVARLPAAGDGPGRVVFVRHTAPGERVRARLTDTTSTSYWRADAVAALEPSAGRVVPAWPAAGPGGVGGGELSHLSLPAQREWKAAVVVEQLERLAQVEAAVVVEEAPSDGARGGLGYRTRVELVADGGGRLGMYRHRTHEVVPLDGMPLAAPAIAGLDLFGRRWPAGSRVTALAPRLGEPLVLVGGEPWRGTGPDRRPNARRAVTESVRMGDFEFRYRVAGTGFWQVHDEAPEILVGAVLGAADGGALDDARVLDLYSGAGLFTAPLADAVGDGGTVVAVEGDPRAAADARRNAHGADNVELHHGEVGRTLQVLGATADVVVLDPPRKGAGAVVVEAVVATGAQRVVYVACDPAALARDVAYFAGRYQLTGLRALDLFPHTHHVEVVAVLERL